jgi:foldase protein PrsA
MTDLKDKLKGLLAGLLIGSMVTGSVAYAANSKAINVYILDLKYKLDGIEKPVSNAKGILYNNLNYVPIRAVTEAIGKDVSFDKKTGTLSISEKKDLTVIATYDGGTITQDELDTYIALNNFYFGVTAASDQQLVAEELISFKWLAASSEAAFGKEADNVTTESFEQVIEYFGSLEALNSELNKLKITESGLKQLIKQNYLVGKALETKVTDAAVKAEYDRQRQADSASFVSASVRHILIALEDSMTGESLRTDEEALTRAKEVRVKLVAGGDFAELAKQYSDDPGSEETGGLYADAELTQFVEEFKKAGVELPLNQISEPVKTDYGYHIMKVESRVTKTVEQVKAELVPDLINQAYQTFLDKELPGLIKSINVSTTP